MSKSSNVDPALETLFLPFDQGLLSWPAAATLFLRARYGAPMQRHSAAQFVCEQPFRPNAQALEQSGLTVLDEAAACAARYPLVLLLPPRQRDESRASMARALAALAPGGRIVVSAS